MGGRFAVESVAEIAWNTHVIDMAVQAFQGKLREEH